jgi:hypothetical protein
MTPLPRASATYDQRDQQIVRERLEREVHQLRLIVEAQQDQLALISKQVADLTAQGVSNGPDGNG